MTYYGSNARPKKPVKKPKKAKTVSYTTKSAALSRMAGKKK